MLNKFLKAAAAVWLAGAAAAQDQPLSVIDWVKRHPEQPALTSATVPRVFEPPVTPGIRTPEVTVRPLDTQAPRIIGLVPASVTGLPESLWSGSSVDGLVAQIRETPVFRLPAAQTLLYTVLLTESTAPGASGDAEDALTLARVNTLMRFGAHDPAISLLEQTGVAKDKAHFSAFMDLSLLTGAEDAACAFLDVNPHLAPSMAHRSFCAAREGDWPTAALLFDAGRTLGTISGADAAALERFLHIEAYEESPPLTRPTEITPLLFRLHEAIGEPMPTGSLPRAYAVADLRDLVGWKTQLEAAERVALTGALPANRLLGLYTARSPAASGGVWDRVRAVQRFETALRTRSPDAISKSLPTAWSAMENAGLEMIFAELFAEPLTRYALDGESGRIAQSMALLSPAYVEQAAQAHDTPPLLKALALGEVETFVTEDTRTDAIVRGFDTDNARNDLLQMARNNRMGEAILRALTLLERGASGDPVALTNALATLRAFGLEDSARRAALQITLLERFN